MGAELEAACRFCSMHLNGLAMTFGDDFDDLGHLGHDAANETAFLWAHENAASKAFDFTFVDEATIAGRIFCSYCAGPFAAELMKCPHCGAPVDRSGAAG